MSRKRFVVAMIALAMLASLASDAAAQNPFIIDGSVPANGTLGGPTLTPDPWGSVRELGAVNGTNTKVGVIHSAIPPMLAFTNPNGQVDLRNIWTQTSKSTDGHVWFYFAWERDANTGSGFIAYEFQQASLAPTCAYTAAGIDMILPETAGETSLIETCNPWRNRQAGDFLIMWDQSGNALNIFKRVFTLSGGELVLGPSQPLGTAVAAISPDGFRGEAAIDLTVDVFPPGGTCVNFANIIPGTVTGNSDTADYKDTVLSTFAPISSCGIVTVTKVTQPGSLSGSFPYTLARADGAAIRHDGTLQVEQTLTHDGDSTGSPITNLIAGTNYTLTEGALASPWEMVSISCTTDGQPPVDLTGGGTFVVEVNAVSACTITNKLKRGSIRVVKNVINDHGGTALPSAFTIALGDSANTVFPGASGAGTTFQFDEGYAFNVNEIGLPAGYVQLSIAGDCSGTIVADVTKVCTITNDDIAPQLTVIKHVVNDNGGTATAGQWTMNVAATNPSLASFAGAEAPGTTITLSAGAFDVSESGGPAGYAQTSAVGCTGTIALGETKTCTITNDDQPPSLTLVKVVVNDNGGTAVAADFTLSANGPTPISGAGGATSGATFLAGSYALSEATVAGYSASAWVCTGTGTQTGSTIAVANGQSATCTITNNDQPPSLTLVKTVVNDNGGTAVAADFTLSANGPTPISGAGGATSGATFSAGSYALSETTVAGYSASAWVCTGTGTQTGSSIALANGQSATCTITNDDQPPSLTLVKVVINDNGGTAAATDFTLSANGPTPIAGAGGAASGATFSAGSYALSETSVAGYSASAWVCTGSGTQTGSSIALANGQSATCTITNNDQPPSLTLVKVVVNDNGGTAVTTDFTLSANGPTPISGAGGATSGANFSAGSYALSETTVAGYTASAWVCTGTGTQSGSSIAVANGQSATCTITNDDQPPTLTLVKVVINDNGGTAVTTDFTLTASGPTPISGAGGATSGANFSAGTYALSETLVAGYTAGAWSCTGNGTQNGASIALANGQSATCTIINNDDKAAPSAVTAMRWVLHDSATVSGIRAGAPDAASATITFRLYGPNDATCSTPINGGGEVRPASGGTASTAAGFMVGEGQVGTYRWIASYSGDQFNLPAVTACGAETHTITIP